MSCKINIVKVTKNASRDDILRGETENFFEDHAPKFKQFKKSSSMRRLLVLFDYKTLS